MSSIRLLICGLTLAAATLLGVRWMETPGVQAANGEKVFELRTYHCFPGKLPDLEKRFREHTMTIFERHGMHNVAYFVPTEEPLAGKTLVYIISHASREQAKQNWAAFRSDPEWVKVAKASEANGKLVEKVDSVYMTSADFSPMK